MPVRTPKEGETNARAAAVDMPDPARDLVRLAEAANPFQAHIWQQALQEEGIRCQVLGDYLGAGVGDIPGLHAEVWVEAADVERAESLLRQHQDRTEKATSLDENPCIAIEEKE